MTPALCSVQVEFSFRELKCDEAYHDVEDCRGPHTGVSMVGQPHGNRQWSMQEQNHTKDHAPAYSDLLE